MRAVVLLCFLSITAVTARSACDEVSFVNRTGWGARDPTSITNLTGKPLPFYVIHHSYEPASCYDDETCIQRVRSIQNFHIDGQKWADVGYHFLVGENGKVYEGRGWDREGAHSPGFNTAGYGICIIGNFTGSPPNKTALNAVRLWMNCGVERGYVKENYIITHRQSQQPNYTECPGDGTFKEVKTWPRFCSFQNSGANLTGNESRASIARLYCQKELTSGSSTASYHITCLIILMIQFHLCFIYFL